MKLNLVYILIFTLFVSCKENSPKDFTNLKSRNISEYVDLSESDSIYENWVKKDSLFLNDLKEILQNDESDIIGILKIDDDDKRTKLGFGYEQIEGSMGKGYAGIYYNLILKEGQISSYEFIPDFPRNTSLKERYKEMFSGIFKIEDSIIQNRYYNIEEMENPLNKGNSNILLNENLKFLMTPFSGTRYGFSGGITGSAFTNRAIFLQETKDITPEVCRILMNSINPGTRLMAIEYYLKNKSDFENRDLVNNWIDKVYSELPNVETMEGCFVMQRDSKELVSEYVKRKN